MSTYVIGDVQGCFDELDALLKLVQYHPQIDFLWFAGDLVCRGPKSLETLRFVKDLNTRGQAVTILGNHELHLLSVNYAPNLPSNKEKQKAFLDILKAPDRNDLCEWLRQQPFLHHDETLGYVMTHAGIFPYWSIDQAVQYAHELASAFQKTNLKTFFANIYGDYPNEWHSELTGWDRLRFITNVFTRMRFCTKEGKLDYEYNGPIGSQPEELVPWFELPNHFDKRKKLLFGHWAAIKGKTNHPSIFALDEGCVWGGNLIAMRLEDQQRFKVSRVSKVED